MKLHRTWIVPIAVLVGLSVLSGCRPSDEQQPPRPSDRGAESQPGVEEPRPVADSEKSRKKPLDLSFVPEECFVAMVVHPRRLIDSPLAQELSEDVAEQVPVAIADILGEMTGHVDADPRTMDQVVVLGLPHEPTGRGYQRPLDLGFVVRFAEPIADEELMGKLSEHIDFADEKATHEGKQYHKGYLKWFPPPGQEEPPDTNRPADLAVHLPDDRTMAFAHGETALKKMLSAKDVKSELVEGLRRIDADNDLILVAMVRGADEPIDRLTEELEGALPPGMRGLLKVPALAKAATFAADLRGDPVAELIVEASDADSAAKLKGLIDDSLTVIKASFIEAREDILKDMPPGAGQSFIELIDETLAGVTLAVDGDRVTVTLTRPRALAKLPGIFDSVHRRNAARAERANKLHQIGLAMNTHEARHDRFPPAAVRDKDGKPLLSWRVTLLPYLEGGNDLYDEFHLDEPWDSPHNVKLIDRMPEVYRIPRRENDGKTTLMAFVGPGTLMGSHEETSPDEVSRKHGAVDKIIVVEAGPDKAVPWTKPEDLPFDPDDPLAALGNIPDDVFLVLFSDGSVHQFRRDIDVKTLRGMIHLQDDAPRY